MKVIISPSDYGDALDFENFESIVYTLAMHYQIKSARINTLDNAAVKVFETLDIPVKGDVSLQCAVLEVGLRHDDSPIKSLTRAWRIAHAHTKARLEHKCKK